MIQRDHPALSVSYYSEPLSICLASFCHMPKGEDLECTRFR